MGKTSPHHELHDLSQRRRVFIVGDIHGEYGELEKALAAVNFDSQHDSLISVGDLVDRGPSSQATFDWINQSWFFRVLGNHELFPRAYLNRTLSSGDASAYGGDWFLKYSKKELEKICDVLEDAPYALTIITPGGRRIGVTHGDCMSDWDNHISCIDKRWVKELSMYSRKTIKRLAEEQKARIPFDVEMARVSNIDHVFHGHTVLGRPLTVANRSWIDTGACFGGDLTLLDIDQFLNDRGVA